MSCCWSQFLAGLAVLAAVLYMYCRKCYSFWSSRGVPGPRPFFPLGNLFEMLRMEPLERDSSYLERYGRVYGIYQTTSPKLVVCEPELIKQITVKDFPTFVNRRQFNQYHPMWNENLFNVRGEEKWKRIRSITSPTFTSGKLKGMQAIMSRSIENLGKYFDHILEAKGNEPQSFDSKEVISGLTVDIIATTTFATETDANDPTNRNKDFVRKALGLFNINLPKAIVLSFLPRALNDLLGFRLIFPAENFDFLCDLSRQIVKMRIENPDIKRNDLVQLLLNSSVDKKTLEKKNYDHLAASMDNDETSHEAAGKTAGAVKLTDDEVIAQCIIFFIAGFETTASTLTYLLYEVAMNQDIQDRLVAELNEALVGMEPSSPEYYDKIMTGIPYLEAVVKETLRKYPPVARLFREAGKDTQIGDIHLPKGSEIQISVSAVHHDPANYEEPERFDPERFMPENKHKLLPYTYLPFGSGPRNCVGMRFAYQEVKLCLAQMMPKFRFTPNANTPKQLEFRKNLGLMLVKPHVISVSRR